VKIPIIQPFFNNSPIQPQLYAIILDSQLLNASIQFKKYPGYMHLYYEPCF
jgi:hypothetical protein